MGETENHGPAIVLIVEDDPNLGEQAAAILQAGGFDVLTAGCADAALTAFRCEPRIRVVFIDINMPDDGGDGLALAERIRTDWPNVDIVVAGGKREDRLTSFLKLLREFSQP